MNYNNKIEIKKTKPINIILIIILCLIAIFILVIMHFYSLDNEVKEIVVDWSEPQHTVNAFDILLFPIIVAIYFFAKSKKKLVVDANIEISDKKIIIKYLNKKYIMDMKSISKASLKCDENNYKLILTGMPLIVSNKKYKNCEFVFLNDPKLLYDNICDSINESK